MSVQNSIIIVTHNSKEKLLKLLANLAVSEAVTSEFIVVDSGSFDGSAELMREDFPAIRLIRLEDNRGFSVAVNRGFAEAIGGVVIFCHADIVTESHTLIELADRIREGADNRVVAAVPRLVNANRQELPLVGPLPGLGRAMGNMFVPTAARGCDAAALDHVADHEFVQMPCVAIDAEVLHKFGGFDERFFLYYADADLCARLHEKSLRIVIRRDLPVVHTGADPSRPLPASLARIMRKDLLRYVEKHQPGFRSTALGLQAKLIGAVNKEAI
jgi:N-acetylglucosaminyl-diphospho-decaprenol L-rhamnosyltransferase